MIYAKRGLIVLVTAVGFLSIAASAAQAEGNWRIEGGSISATKKVATTSTGDVTIEIPEGGSVFSVLCKEFAIDEFSLLVKGFVSGQMLLTKCELFSSGKKIGCIVEVVTPKFKGELFLHEERSFVLILPETGTALFTLKFTPKEECPVETPITGSMVLQDVTSGGSSWSPELVEHEVKFASAKLFPKDVLKYGTGGPTVGFIGPTLHFSLTGADAGKKWSGLG